jgi:hypothetical protein
MHISISNCKERSALHEPRCSKPSARPIRLLRTLSSMLSAVAVEWLPSGKACMLLALVVLATVIKDHNARGIILKKHGRLKEAFGYHMILHCHCMPS